MEPVMYKTADEIIVELREEYKQLHDAAKAVTDHWGRHTCGGIEEKIYKLRDILAAGEAKS